MYMLETKLHKIFQQRIKESAVMRIPYYLCGLAEEWLGDFCQLSDSFRNGRSACKPASAGFFLYNITNLRLALMPVLPQI
jgi:hypothetical protein